MMKCHYDLHIHTGLSPCAVQDMTPNNIVNMAVLNGLDAIAVTDHNSCGNVEVVMELGKQKEVVVIPGIEVETREEIHVLCLFSDLYEAYEMEKIVYDHLPSMENKASIFGKQFLYDIDDEIIGENPRFLSTATNLSLEKVFDFVYDLGGIPIPAHIDRPSYSIISNLGWIPEDIEVSTIEVSRYCEDYKAYQEKYNHLLVLQNSDAHELGYIYDRHRSIEVKEMRVKAIISRLLQGKSYEK